MSQNEEKASVETHLLKDSKPAASRILSACFHSWQLERRGDTFILFCFWCNSTQSARALPVVFQHVLDAVVKLDPVYDTRERVWKVSEADVRRAVSSLGLPSGCRSERAWVWDVYATLRILLCLKGGGARGDLAVKSRTLTKLVEVAMWPPKLKEMPLSSQKRYKFVLDAIRLVPAQLARQSSFFSVRRPE